MPGSTSPPREFKGCEISRRDIRLYCGDEELVPMNWQEFSHLEGRLLTFIDASVPDHRQCEAQKSLIRGIVSEWVQDRYISIEYADKMEGDQSDD